MPTYLFASVEIIIAGWLLLTMSDEDPCPLKQVVQQLHAGEEQPRHDITEIRWQFKSVIW